MNTNSIAKYWSDISLLDKCNEQNGVTLNGDTNTFLFFDGPPFMTGTPHYGHILAGYIKDTITRFHSSNGKYVPRVSGADTHGVPIEYEIDKLLGLKSSQDILKFGIKEYNNECRNIVLRCSSVWEEQSALLGRLIDYSNGYKTMSLDYMNSVWYTFKQLHDNSRVYSGYRVLGHSTACGTSLSNFELQQNYQDTNTVSIYVCMYIHSINAYAIVWTTTPWTLLANYTLCVHPDIEYSIVSVEDANKNSTTYICSTTQLQNVFGKQTYTAIKSVYGRELNGLKYNAPYNFNNNDTYITTATFVTPDTGTGIVHIAPAYGIDDFNHCNNLDTNYKLFQYLDDNGNVMQLPEFNDTPHYIGLFYKDLSKVIINELKTNNTLFDKRNINHSVPFCWRSDTEIIYKASSSWFVKVSDMRERMCELNNSINWYPKNIQTRFGNWLANANDWNISRNRFWGTPIPIWISPSGNTVCISSSYELERLCGLPKDTITDLHRDSIDHLTFTLNDEVYTRITDVFDCWFESGAMPYATVRTPHGDGVAKNIEMGATVIATPTEVHLRLLNGNTHKILPAEFIAEGVDQTRGWFYTLMVLSASLYNVTPFKNVIVNGHILANDGKKMSKRLKNYPDPMELLDKYGADAIRLYLLKSVTLNTDTLKFSPTDVHQVNSDIIIPLLNTVAFLKEYSQLFTQQTHTVIDIHSTPNYTLPINMWLINSYQTLRDDYNKCMNNYSIRDAITTLYQLVDALNKCYIRIGRNYLKGKGTHEDWFNSLHTLLWVIQQFVVDYRDIVPFLCEHIHMTLLSNNSSVHLVKRRSVNFPVNNSVINFIDNTYNIIKYVYQYRSNRNIPFKRPINVNLGVETVHYDRNSIVTECNISCLQEHKLYNTDTDVLFIINKITLYKRYSKTVLSTTLEQLYNTLHSMSQKSIVEVLRIGSLNGVIIDTDLFDIPDNDIVYCTNSNNETKMVKVIIDSSASFDTLSQQYYRTIASTIQKKRKAMGLHSFDPVTVTWSGTPDYPFDNTAKGIIESIIGTEFNGTLTVGTLSISVIQNV